MVSFILSFMLWDSEFRRLGTCCFLAEGQYRVDPIGVAIEVPIYFFYSFL